MARRKHYNYYDAKFIASAVAPTKIIDALAKDVAEALGIHTVMLYRKCIEARRGVPIAKKKDINIDPKVRSELKLHLEVGQNANVRLGCRVKSFETFKKRDFFEEPPGTDLRRVSKGFTLRPCRFEGEKLV